MDGCLEEEGIRWETRVRSKERLQEEEEDLSTITLYRRARGRSEELGERKDLIWREKTWYGRKNTKMGEGRRDKGGRRSSSER